MAKQKKPTESYNRFAFCDQNEALLYQFFLHECLVIFQKMQDKSSFDTLPVELLGNSYDSSSYAKKGHLQKMRDFCSLMQTHVKNPDVSHLKKLGSAVNRLTVCIETNRPFFSEETKEYKKIFQKVKRHLKKVIGLLFEKLTDFLHNENVLFFLLRRHSQFDHLYEEPIIAKTIALLFPGGLLEAESFLTVRYTQKGFHHLVPVIREKMAVLKNAI